MMAGDEASRKRDLLGFLDAGVTPYHAVRETVRRLEAAAFTRLDDAAAWQLGALDRRFVIKNETTIVAFHVGEASPAEAGFMMIGAHTDSPVLRLKPNAAYAQNGYRQLGVEVYGGVLLSTWADRDLSVAGRLTIARDRRVESVLVDLALPVARVPSLAIHLNRDVNKAGLVLDPQKHLPPIIALDGEPNALLERAAQGANVKVDDVLGFDLSLYDTQKASIGGLEGELIASARLDNLASCHAAVSALIDASITRTRTTKLIVLYDHEEVGSRSAQGAEGPFLRQTLERIVDATGNARQGMARAMSQSFLISADMAHAIHPNHADKHEPKHSPVIGKGPVIKTNANQSYASDGSSSARFTLCCKESGFSPQQFVIRTDLPCGSTIGPITAAALGVRTVDVGNPMLAMHSIRETAGVADAELMYKALVTSYSL
ncbi:MAG: M18 family aminopeptidase [Deltaproteobacteria bacterium]|nr:M18 family aminopeptidase [Deltaproteobacteria bacterium]